MDCLFCAIIANQIPAHRVYEDDRVLAFLDIHPKTKGHTLIIPKTHARNLYDIADDDIAHIAVVAKKIATAMGTSLNTAGVNLLQSNEPAAQQEVFHFHLHVIPRYADDQHISFATHEEPGDLAALAALIRETV